MSRFILFALCALAFAFPASAQSFGPSIGPNGEAKIGALAAANFNSTADQGITLTCPTGTCVVSKMIIYGCTAQVTTAKGAFYSGASKTGVIFFAGATTTQFQGTLGSDAIISNSSYPVGGPTTTNTLTFTSGTPITVYLSLTTAQGSALTCNIDIFGDEL